MGGVRRRLEREDRQALAMEHSGAIFSALTQSKAGLKPLTHYLRSEPREPSVKRMMQTLEDARSRGAPMTITRISRKEVSNGDNARIAADQPRPG